jgi:hypothetical protein
VAIAGAQLLVLNDVATALSAATAGPIVVAMLGPRNIRSSAIRAPDGSGAT